MCCLTFLILYFFGSFAKVGEAVRLAPGVDASTKLLGLADGFYPWPFQTSMPGAAVDWLVGLIGAALVRLVVYVKGKKCQKSTGRMWNTGSAAGHEGGYCSFLWTPAGKQHHLTQTEGLMMSGRPKNPRFCPE